MSYIHTLRYELLHTCIADRRMDSWMFNNISHSCETADDDIKSVTTKEQVEKLANQIEEDLFSIHNEITVKYKNKYRSLLFNLRDSKNQVS